MRVGLVYDERMARYDLGAAHPLKPERFTLAVRLMDAYGLLTEEPAAAEGPAAGHGAGGEPGTRRAEVFTPEPATDEELLRVHTSGYLAAVKEASRSPGTFRPRMGLGHGDNPIFPGMHDAGALICGGALLGLRSVVSGEVTRTFNVAGGLHHAHRERASGFCVYNDPAVAIADALRRHEGLRVAYLDVDAHHGDGVQEAFYEEPGVLTVSVHESGRYLFPGTGFVEETGAGAGEGYALNVPMPAYATDECYRVVLDQVVAPALRAFAPDVVVAQLGADTHHDDPLTTLGVTLPGYRDMVRDIVRMSDELCEGRLAAFGGGGYGAFSVVPRAWTMVTAELLGAELPEELPGPWREASAEASRSQAPVRLSEDDVFRLAPEKRRALLESTQRSVTAARAASPLLVG